MKTEDTISPWLFRSSFLHLYFFHKALKAVGAYDYAPFIGKNPFVL